MNRLAILRSVEGICAEPDLMHRVALVLVLLLLQASPVKCAELSPTAAIESKVEANDAAGASAKATPKSVTHDPIDEEDIFDKRLKKTGELSPAAKQLAVALNIFGAMQNLKERRQDYLKRKDTGSAVEMILVQTKLSQSVQYASLELEEALANVDGDLAQANMLLAFVSTKRDRGLLMNNVATFVGSGAFGILDSSTSINMGPPTPNVFGIIGNSIATGLPLLALRTPRYESPRHNKGRTNMLAPIFGRTYQGEGYDPIIWHFIESVPATSKTNKTRLQLLLENWKSFRGLENGAQSKEYIDALVGAPSANRKLTLDLIKTRAELLVDLRALIQSMYRDISELNNAIMDL